MSFPENFAWGAATASYQIEGAVREGGRGSSVWDDFTRAGRSHERQTGDVACDHYHRYREDVALMREFGLGAYRFSVAWPRIQPEGRGAVNEAGLDFYDRLVDELLAANVTPWLTLFHWDLPSALQVRGGWLNPDVPGYFAEYAAILAERFSDRVAHWMTLNEPQCFIGLGLHTGEHAPGLTLSRADALQAGHHALLAHGHAVRALRAGARQPLRIGFAPVGVGAVPASEEARDVEAARAWMFGVRDDLWNNAWWADPVLLGRYPEEGLARYGADAPRVAEGDLAVISEPTDFYGVNLYHGATIRAGEGGPEKVPTREGHPQTAYDWKLTPEVMRWAPRFYHERYGLPVVITENGMAGLDWVSLDGRVDDPQRIDFTRRYLRELRRACAEGVPVEGYFHWTWTDNFEWAQGFSKRFGLIHTDFVTQVRTPKASAAWYRDVIASNGANL
ncbi:beta-galactosidase [Deinococcus aerius]|uniref:Beta-glucosidase n=1 Tax=Deinococcus aerius TaxID=200253 RepID=A0A2I9DTT7_9DEIO|nr:GH1 family beta-glucosidase [Deinococcus aerius]GBF06077.1 beta-galactosidase [Deinococcus aerius]